MGVRIKVGKNKDNRKCTRCGGSKVDPLYGGACQKCGGSGEG
jgi:hypothetical protein